MFLAFNTKMHDAFCTFLCFVHATFESAHEAISNGTKIIKVRELPHLQYVCITSCTYIHTKQHDLIKIHERFFVYCATLNYVTCGPPV